MGKIFPSLFETKSTFFYPLTIAFFLIVLYLAWLYSEIWGISFAPISTQ